jgi:hypothetical protein
MHTWMKCVWLMLSRLTRCRVWQTHKAGCNKNIPKADTVRVYYDRVDGKGCLCTNECGSCQYRSPGRWPPLPYLLHYLLEADTDEVQTCVLHSVHGVDAEAEEEILSTLSRWCYNVGRYRYYSLRNAISLLTSWQDNIDTELVKYLQKYFPKETRQKQIAIETADGFEQYGLYYKHPTEYECAVM